MVEPAEFVVPMKRWPAYLLAGCVTCMFLLQGVYVGLIVWLLSTSGAAQAMLFSIPFLFTFLPLMLTIAVMRMAFQILRHPPRLSAQGIGLWLVPTSQYVLVTWPRVLAVRTRRIGVFQGMLVEVQDPDALVSGQPAKVVRRNKVLIRRFGTPFAFAAKTAPAILREVDQRVWQFSGGRLRLAGQPGAMRPPVGGAQAWRG